MIKELLKEGADPAQAGRHVLPPLHLAAMMGNETAVQVNIKGSRDKIVIFRLSWMLEHPFTALTLSNLHHFTARPILLMIRYCNRKNCENFLACWVSF